ncbi:flagellar hook capping protein [Peptococcaceae bacterium]|nr:flagellar hook capping protein [Peptococcaceae bacterium]MCL0062605.1 flagellar hook capping protein [Peptococcaceae bacterium]
MDVTQINQNLYLPEQKPREPKQVLDKDTFLMIMIEQLKHQNPMEPVGSDKFLSQMAQFTIMEQLLNLNQSFEAMIKMQKINNAAEMIGKSVKIATEEGLIEGTVEKVAVRDDKVQVVVNNIHYDLDKITEIS